MISFVRSAGIATFSERLRIGLMLMGGKLGIHEFGRGEEPFAFFCKCEWLCFNSICRAA